ncbi:beta strand repeat-containing protein [Fontivita pretiosa]|uniref:beta strand repeat-containing protein n=1 Tax=Fontivita pretiosa TaxID=2989684 RepID=UPI003D173821
MRSRTTLYAAAGALLSPALFAQTTAVSYSGPAGDVWHNPQNWMPNIIPDNDLGAMPPILYTAEVNKPVDINGYQFDIAGLSNSSLLRTFTSWDFDTGSFGGAPYLLNTGTFSIVPQADASAILGVPFGQTLTISGGGTFRLGGAGSARIRGLGTFINQDNAIRGTGTLGEGFLLIENHGVIAATANDAGGAGTLLIHPGGGGGLTNANTLQARDMGNLELRGTYHNSGGTIVADAGGVVHFRAAQVLQGSITGSGGGLIRIAFSTRWRGPLQHSASTQIDSTELVVDDVITNTSHINVGGGQLRIDTQASLMGGGSISLLGGRIERWGNAPATLMNHNNISGLGQIGAASMSITNASSATMTAQAFTLTIDPGDGFTNQGTLMANGGTLVLLGGTFNNASGTIHAAENSVVQLNSARISGGKLTSAGNGVFSVPIGYQPQLQDVDSMDARINVSSGSGGLRLQGSIPGAGSLVIRGSQLLIGPSSTLGVTTTLEPGSTIRADGSGSFSDGARGRAPGNLLINNGTISGAGSIGINALQITNTGVIRADGGGTGLANSLTIDPGPDGLLNSGLIEATGLGTVILTGNGSGAFVQSGSGIIRATDATSNVQLFNNARFSGGQLGAGAGTVSAAFGTITLENLTNNARLVQVGVSTLLLNGAVVNNGSITTPVNGRLVVAGGSTVAGGLGHLANNGSIIVSGGGQLNANFIEGTGRTTVEANATVRAQAIRQANLTINTGGRAVLSPASVVSPQATRLGSLSLAAGAQLDLNDNKAIVNSGSLPTITAQIKSGLENGGAFDWQGDGIASTTAAQLNAAAASYLHGLGVLRNDMSQIGGSGPIYTSFGGQTLVGNEVLVGLTYFGDADLSGTIEATDYSLIDNGYVNGSGGWLNGDFDYSGTIDPTDYALIDNAYVNQSGPQAQAMITEHTKLFGEQYLAALRAIQAGAIPDPSAVAMLAVLASPLLVRRRQGRAA